MRAAKAADKRDEAIATLAELLQKGELMLTDLTPPPRPDLLLTKAISFADGEQTTVHPDEVDAGIMGRAERAAGRIQAASDPHILRFTGF